jgi:histidinol-phosphatase
MRRVSQAPPPPSRPAAAADDLRLALQLADIADEITLARFRAVDLAVATKPDLTPVSEADTAVERALRERLALDRPGDSILGEEYGAGAGATGASAPRRWIVDPIDGTKSYVRGVPVWATLLALQDGGELTVGVVSAPALGRRWWAARGAGAFGSDALHAQPRPLRVSSISELADAQLCFGGIDDFLVLNRLDAIARLASRCWRTRGYGDFWSYMLVAEGAVEIGLDPDLSLWDFAAPKVIVEEAGGRFTDFGGSDAAADGSALASNGLLHDAARAILAA